MSPWTALIPWLFVRVLPGGRIARWRTGIDLPVLLAAGVLSGSVCWIWLSAFYLEDTPLIGSSDFREYCASTVALADGQVELFTRNRSVLAGWLAGVLARRWGTLDGLLGSAVASSCLLGFSVGLWARAVHSRGAGILAALAVGVVAPLCILSRTLTYYPPIIAVLTLCAATGAVAMRWRSAAACLLAGMGAGLALLVDARGLAWALPTLGLGLLAALRGSGRWRPSRVPLRLALLIVPVCWSYALGAEVYPADASSLEAQLKTVEDLRIQGIVVREEQRPVIQGDGYVWGRAPLSQIPATLRHVSADGRLVPDSHRAAPQVTGPRSLQVDPWIPLALGALLVSLPGLVRRPMVLLGAVGPAVPFLLSLDSAIVVKQSHSRFLANALPFLPVLLGVGAASVAGLGRDWRRTVAASLIGLLVVLGAIPTWLSPVASWRRPAAVTDRELQRVQSMARGELQAENGADRSCARGLTGEGSRFSELMQGARRTD